MKRIGDYFAFTFVLSCIAVPFAGMIAGLLYLSHYCL